VLELVDCRERSLEALESVEPAESGQQVVGLLLEDLGQASCLGGGLLDVVDDDRLGDRLDPVDDIIEARDELVDVLAVERGDEGVLEPAGQLAAELVAPLLERLDLRHPLVETVELGDQIA
jgi:hypothetical protein